MNIVGLSDFRNNISDYINRIVYKDETLLLKRGSSIVVKIIPYDEKKETESKKKRLLELAGLWKNVDVEKIKKKLKKIDEKGEKDTIKLIKKIKEV